MNETDAPDRFPDHDGGAWSPLPCAVVASWPVGHFAENLAIDAAGAVLVSLHSHNRIDRYDPATGQVSVFATLPAPVAGLAFDTRGTLWATGGMLGTVPGYVWRIAPDGTPSEWARLPDAHFLNGCALHPNGRDLLVCDSLDGRVLTVDLQAAASRTWLADERLASPEPPTPGANGIKVAGGAAIVSVTGRNLLLRVPVLADGAAGSLEILAERLRADDFAVAASGALYIATHPAQTVMRLRPDGARATLAGPDQGAVGSTACAFGRTAADRDALYVTTNGGLWTPYRGSPREAKLLRIAVGEPGSPLPPGG